MSTSCQEHTVNERLQDQFQMLDPKGTKLTSIDSLRAIRVFDDAIQYSEIMACLEEAIRLVTNDGPRGSELDDEVVAKLEQYQMLLDIFADVTSWRRMTANDLHLPSDTTEALIKASYSTVVGLQCDNIEQVPDGALLKKLVGMRTSGQPDAVSSISDKFIQGSRDIADTNSSNIFYEMLSFTFDNKNSSENDEKKTTVDEISVSGLTQIYLQDNRPNDEQNEKSDNDKHSFMSSSSIQFKGQLEFEYNSEYPVSDFSRFVTSTRYLKVVHEEMQNKLRILIRTFRSKPAAIDRMLNCHSVCKNELQQHKIAMFDYINQLKELNKLISEMFLTTPLEILERQEYLDEVQQHIDDLERREHNLQNELTQETKLKQEQMRAFDDTIDVLVHDLSLVQHLSTEYVKRIREDADKQQKSDRNNSAIRHATGVQLTEQLKADLTKARREYWAGEAVHRKKKYNLEEEINNLIRTYDCEMTTLQDDYDETLAQYKIEKAQLDALEIRFAPLSLEFDDIMGERDDVHHSRETVKREKLRQVTAASAIQAWWRSYRLRKALTTKEKKLAKLAKQGDSKEN